MWAVQAVAGWLVIIVAQLAGAFFSGQGWLYGTALLCLIVGAAHAAVMPWWRYRVHCWETTAEAMYTVDGWVNQEWRAAPISRIQTVDTKRSLIQRFFGLSTVTVTTASAAGALMVNGLDSGVAQRLVDELTSITQATRGDAT